MVRCSAPSLVLVAALGAAYVGAQQGEHARTDACEKALPHEPTPPPIMTLRTRDHEVALYAGDEPTFTVLDRHGMVLADRIDTDAFAERFPALDEQLRGAFANGAWIDATALPRRGGTADAEF
ncbi:MAG TPA: hypothetical protein VG755_23240 [Nannocystaceae bacterium]|nr:hypothetical protein [Nannocystaceae bacterium]